MQLSSDLTLLHKDEHDEPRKINIHVRQISDFVSENSNIPEAFKRCEWAINDFIIITLLAKKHHVKIYLAQDKISNSYVVLKIYNIERINKNTVYREICIHQKATSYHVPILYASFMDGPYCIIVQEFISGLDLISYMSRNSIVCFSENELKPMMRDVIRALVYLHSIGICHRDIKPSNIFIDEHTKKIKLADFSISVDMNSEEVVPVGGTKIFMAPEIKNIFLKKINGVVVGNNCSKLSNLHINKSDIWSLGITMYFLLVGFQPITFDDIPSFPKNISSEARDLIIAMLRKSPSLRPSAMDLLNSEWFADILVA